jgi:hypothetical protein
MMRRWIISPGLPLVLAAIGTIGLINSWARQNRELVRANENVYLLQRSQLVIDIDEIARDQWLIAIDQEIAKEKPNSEFLVVAARGALEGFLRWQTHMEGRVDGSTDEYKKELAARGSMLAQADKLVEAKDYRSLTALLQNLTEMSHNLHSTNYLDNQFFSAVDVANTKVAENEGRVLFWYVLGTSLLFLSSMLASVFLEVTLRRMETNKLHLSSHPSKKRK